MFGTCPLSAAWPSAAPDHRAERPAHGEARHAADDLAPVAHAYARSLTPEALTPEGLTPEGLTPEGLT